MGKEEDDEDGSRKSELVKRGINKRKTDENGFGKDEAKYSMDENNITDVGNGNVSSSCK